jgi:tetratricopeptide (TPR) repeat protein
MADRRVLAQVGRNLERWLERAAELTVNEYWGVARAIQFGLKSSTTRLTALKLARICLAGGYGQALAARLCAVLEAYSPASRGWQAEARMEFDLALARARLEAGRTSADMERFSGLERRARAASRLDWQAELRLARAMACMTHGDLEGCRRFAADVAAQKSPGRRVQEAQLDAWMLLGRGAALYGDHRAALRMYRQGEALAGRLGNVRKQMQCLSNEALCLLEGGAVREALSAIGKAIQAFRQRGDVECEARAEFVRAVIHLRSGRSGPGKEALGRAFGVGLPGAAAGFGGEWSELAQRLQGLADDGAKG